MKLKIFIAAILLPCFYVAAQTVNIPDPYFEQILIEMNIDSDGTVNGHVLVSDVVNVTELNIDLVTFDGTQITSVAGLEAFTSLESLTIVFTQITTLDVSHNTQLKSLNCRSNSLTGIDVSLNPLLESLYIGNDGDVAPTNYITQLDLSHNPNIKFIDINNLAAGMEWINLKNGNNNPDMEMDFQFSFPFPENTHVICIEVDDADLAISDQYPYSEWDIISYDAHYNFSENCTLSVQDSAIRKELYVYPNPVSGILHINKPDSSIVQYMQLYDALGRLVMHCSNISDSSIDVSGLAKGMYVLKMKNGATTLSQKIIVE